MRRVFIIDGKRLSVEVFSMEATAELDETTPVGAEWVRRTPASHRAMHLTGVLPDGQTIDDWYAFVGRDPDGAFRLASEPYIRTMGEIGETKSDE